MNKKTLDVAIGLVLFTAMTSSAWASVTLPETASSAALVGFAVAGLAAIRAFVRK